MTFDQIDRMVREANPVPDPTALEAVAATVLVFNPSRSVDMQTQEHVEVRTEEPRPRWGRLIAVGGVVVALGVLSVLFILNTNESAEPPSESATTVTNVSTTVASVTTTIAPAVTTPIGVSPLGIEVVGVDGSTSNLDLPQDAWMADLSADGQNIVFLTASTEVGFCGGCQPGTKGRMVIVPVGSTSGDFVYFEEDPFELIGQPTWSPDGTRIAFQGNDNGNLDIYVVDLSSVLFQTDGSVSAPWTRLTTDPGVDEFPSWSADGEVIYYDNLGTGPVDSGIAPTGEIWSVPVDGGDPTRLTYNDVADMQPDVAPDGTVAFWSEGEIMVMNPDGSNTRRLETIPVGLGWNPRWSPDGTSLALLRYDPSSARARFDPNPIHATDLPPMDVVIIDVESGDYTTLDVQVASFYNPVSWMPDGTALVVTRYR